MKQKKFWTWRNQAEPDGERVLELYGTIAEQSWFEDDVTPKRFREELFAGSGPVTIWLSSPGGDCIAASQIYAMLMDYPSDVTIKIDGIAASAASVIAMAGTEVLMAPTAVFMVHNPMTFAVGNHDDMQKAINMLDEVKESIINAYEIRTGLSRAKISHLMDQETWMNAKKAIELGFADDVLTDEKRSTAEMPAYEFSSREAEHRLMNCLQTRCRMNNIARDVEETAPENPATTIKDEAIPDLEAEATLKTEDTQPEESGTPIAVLETRLRLLL